MYQKENKCDWQYLNTDRLRLRPIQNSDANLILSMRSDYESMQYVERPLMQSIKEAQLFIANIRELCSKQQAWYWVIEIKRNNKAIGGITLWNYNKAKNKAELGFMLEKDHWGQGYMSEAANAVVDCAFDKFKLHSMEAHTRPENIAARKIISALGFKEDDCLHKNVFFNNQYWDTLVFSKIENDKK